VVPVEVRMLKFKTEVKCPKMAKWQPNKAYSSPAQDPSYSTVDSYTRLKALGGFYQEVMLIGFLQERVKDRVSGAFGKCLSLVLWFKNSQ